MNHPRCSGVLLHPTSLPSRFGSGDFGPGAWHFIDWLANAGQALWQVLPFAPPGMGNSPYMTQSSLAGNPMLVSPEALSQIGLLDEQDLRQPGAQDPASTNRVRFDRVASDRTRLLEIAARNFFGTFNENGEFVQRYVRWCSQNEWWALDYALFSELSEANSRLPWMQWPAELRERNEDALAQARQTHATRIKFWLFVQWQFDEQWAAVREYARSKGVRIIGDMPIYCALDSVDIWQQPGLFQLNEHYTPTAVAGVPPDYFSETGQLWGNPLYDWAAHEREQYSWWCDRMRRALVHADTVRIDHFRAFAAYWAVPFGDETAINGQWRDGPGHSLFDRLKSEIGDLPIIAEDLGTITPDVIELRDRIGLPGMCVLQFAFGDGPENRYLPHNYEPNCVAYTGTHDNDTTEGWFAHASDELRASVGQYLNLHNQPVSWSLIQLCSASVARFSIYPMQDLLAFDSQSRMNTPGEGTGQWAWRFSWNQVPEDLADRLLAMSLAHGRTMHSPG
jgi:4-alpha-glucanotransferase